MITHFLISAPNDEEPQVAIDQLETYFSRLAKYLLKEREEERD